MQGHSSLCLKNNCGAKLTSKCTNSIVLILWVFASATRFWRFFVSEGVSGYIRLQSVIMVRRHPRIMRLTLCIITLLNNQAKVIHMDILTSVTIVTNPSSLLLECLLNHYSGTKRFWRLDKQNVPVHSGTRLFKRNILTKLFNPHWSWIMSFKC